MPEGTSEQEGNEQTEGSVDKLEPSNDNPPVENPANEAHPPQMEAENVASEDVPWQVVQAQDFLPEGVKAQAYFLFNGEYVLVCADGFYGNHEGNVQKLAPKVLVDNVV